MRDEGGTSARLALAHDDDEGAQEVVLEGVVGELVALEELHGQLPQAVHRVLGHLLACGRVGAPPGTSGAGSASAPVLTPASLLLDGAMLVVSRGSWGAGGAGRGDHGLLHSGDTALEVAPGGWGGSPLG